MSRLPILNATIGNEGEVRVGDILIRDGLIERLGADLSAQAADRVIDARSLTVLPGMIDSQVHFREPGMPNKADIASESRAAVAGGITSYLARMRARQSYSLSFQRRKVSNTSR